VNNFRSIETGDVPIYLIGMKVIEMRYDREEDLSRILKYY